MQWGQALFGRWGQWVTLLACALVCTRCAEPTNSVLAGEGCVGALERIEVPESTVLPYAGGETVGAWLARTVRAYEAPLFWFRPDFCTSEAEALARDCQRPLHSEAVSQTTLELTLETADTPHVTRCSTAIGSEPRLTPGAGSPPRVDVTGHVRSQDGRLDTDFSGELGRDGGPLLSLTDSKLVAQLRSGTLLVHLGEKGARGFFEGRSGKAFFPTPAWSVCESQPPLESAVWPAPLLPLLEPVAEPPLEGFSSEGLSLTLTPRETHACFVPRGTRPLSTTPLYQDHYTLQVTVALSSSTARAEGFGDLRVESLPDREGCASAALYWRRGGLDNWSNVLPGATDGSVLSFQGTTCGERLELERVVFEPR
jgi:hypothetical protein